MNYYLSLLGKYCGLFMADGTIHAGTIVQVKPDSLFIGTYEPREIQIKDIDSVVSSLTTEEFKQAKHYG